MNREGDFNYVAHDFWRRRIVMVPPRRNSTYKPSLLYTQQMSKCVVGCHLWMKRENRGKTTRYSGCGAENGRNSGKIKLCF